MRNVAWTLLLISASVVFVAVLVMLRPDAFFSSQTFINESDTTQTLELKVNSRLNSVMPRAAAVLSGGRLLGKQVGLFALKTEQGIITGKFVWMKGPGCCRPDSLQRLVFRPMTGEEWSVTVQTDGSFQDPQGMTWRLKIK
jgi:hypothetical protein